MKRRGKSTDNQTLPLTDEQMDEMEEMLEDYAKILESGPAALIYFLQKWAKDRGYGDRE